MNKKLFLPLLFSTLILSSKLINAEVPVVDDSQNYTQARQIEDARAESEAISASYNDEDEYHKPEATRTISSKETFLLEKIESLQKELQELRGQLEVQSHDLKLLQKQQLAFYKDVDKRLQTSPTKSKETPPQLVLEVPKKTPQKQDTEETPVDNQLVTANKDNKNIADEGLSYAYAYELIENKQYDKASSEMARYLSQYPNGTYAANAHYWLGELYLKANQLEKAKAAFNEVVTKYKDSHKASASLYKLAIIYNAEQQTDKAKELLTAIQQQYPNSSSARLAQIKLEELAQKS